MKNFDHIPVPVTMQHLEIDKRGYPIPYVVARDKFGIPLFVVNDTERVNFCKYKKMCSVCGKAMFKDMWVIGGVQSAFHQRGAYLDTPVHYECGKYALQVCPYLAIRHVNYVPDTIKLSDRLPDNIIAIDKTVDTTKPEMFVFGKITGFTIMPQGYIVPVRPFIQVENWRDGNRLEYATAMQILQENYNIPESEYQKQVKIK